MNGINLEKHHALISRDDVQKICDPVLSSIGINYFNYIKIYNQDCSRELLTNNADWIAHFYQNALYNSVGAVDVEHLLPKGYFLWSEMDIKDPIYLQGRDYFNIDHGITFVIKRNDVTYLYIFASSREQHAINNFYVANIDLLQHFIHYFNDKGHDLIKESEKHKIILPSPQNIMPERVNNIFISEGIRNDFLNSAPVTRYFLFSESEDLYLTTKQAECAKLLANGASPKKIAKIMNISHRTVEGYVLDIKQKIQEKTSRLVAKDQLIQILKQSNIY